MLKLLAQYIPPELLVFFTAMLPLVEIRGAIPLGMTVWELPLGITILCGLAGNIVVTFLALQLIPKLAQWGQNHWSWFDKQLKTLFEKTQTKHNKRMSELGRLALVLFVAIPLPGSGAWSGAVVAYVFGLKNRLALLLISIGLSLAALLLAYGTELIRWIVQTL